MRSYEPVVKQAGIRQGIHLSKGTRRFLLNDGSLVGLGIIIVVFSVGLPYFFTMGNVEAILNQISITGVMAFGLTFVIILGGIDLSVIGIPGFIGSLVALFLRNGYGNWVAIPIGLGAGLVFGLANGLIVTQMKVPIFMSGLGLTYVAQGLDTLASEYQVNFKGISDNRSFLFLGQGKIGPLPVIFLIALVVFVIFHVVITQTRIGRGLYAVGGSEEGASTAGINVKRYKIAALLLSSFLFAMAGILLTSRNGVAIVGAGATGLWMDVLLATLFGTTVLTGGVPHILGTAVGLVFTGVLFNGLTQIGIGEPYQMVTKGALIVGAVSLCAMGGKIINVEIFK